MNTIIKAANVEAGAGAPESGLDLICTEKYECKRTFIIK